jgi:hypothetical protein
MITSTVTEATATATPVVPKWIYSNGSAKSHFDCAVGLLNRLDECDAADYWTKERNRVLSAFGSVRTKSADGDATSKGVDYGSASLSKVLKHLSAPKKESALLSASWAMISALSLK